MQLLPMSLLSPPLCLSSYNASFTHDDLHRDTYCSHVTNLLYLDLISSTLLCSLLLCSLLFATALPCEGFGVYVYGLVDSVEAGVELARTVLYSGKAIETLDKWIAVTQKLTASA